MLAGKLPFQGSRVDLMDQHQHAYPNQTFTGWIPTASPVSKSAALSEIEGKHVKITGRIEMYKGKPEIRINAASQLEIE
jgi:hypothetical protein